MLKALIVVNPIAGGKNKKPVIELINQNLSKDISPEFIYWEKPEQRGEIITRLKNEIFDIAIAVGGDGTINQVASALVNSGKKMGIIPVGSGNGLARHLKIPLRPLDAIEVINRGVAQPMDACKVNDSFFFCTSGVGFDAHIGKLFAENRSRGFFTYIKLTLSELVRYRSQQYKLRVNGNLTTGKAFLITVANASQYGNNAYIAPQARVDDGVMDICVIPPFNIFQFLSIGFKMFNKTLDTSSSVITYRSDEVLIERETEGPIHFDGEPLIEGKVLIYKLLHNALKVIVP